MLKPFNKLRVAELRSELSARGIFDMAANKPDLEKQLQRTLKGVQRVPSLLLLQPNQPISQLNLQDYTILDCEPLHDVKGHILNIFEELPSILPINLKEECTKCIKLCTSKEINTG